MFKQTAFLFIWLFAFSASGEAGRCNRVQELARITARLRGLPLLHSIRCVQVDAEELQHRLDAILAASDSAEKLQHEERAYKILGLIPKNFEYTRCLSRGLSRWITVMYDYVLSGEILVPEGKHVTDGALVHEITHALEDQHYNLKGLHKAYCEKTDSCLALAALSEGDAMVTQSFFEARIGPAAAQHQDSTTLPGSQVNAGDTSCDFPAVLMKQLEFPYSFGKLFVQRLTSGGTFRQVDEAFRKPPESSRVILQGLGGNDLRARSSAKPPMRRKARENNLLVHRDTLGQYTISAFLALSNSGDKAILAAKGWRNDELSLYETLEGRYFVTWKTSWQSANDSKEFDVALKNSLALQFGIPLVPHTAGLRFTSYEGTNVEVERVGDSVSLKIIP